MVSADNAFRAEDIKDMEVHMLLVKMPQFLNFL